MSVKRTSTFFKSLKRTGSAANGSSIPSPDVRPPINDKEQSVTEVNAPQALKEFREQVQRGLPISLNTSTLSAVVDLIRHKESLDDRKLLLEHALVFVSRLDDGPLHQTLKNKIVMLLYNDLCHPPATIISNKHAWRTADGSYNNIDIPDLGKAGTPYSRSVQQSHAIPHNQLPDPGLIFDTLMKRKGFVNHPGGLSSLMFSFATLVIHSVFRTSHRDPTINETSSYVDLAPLYGNNQQDQDKIRIRNGRGMIAPDSFCEDRLLLLPPAVCTLLVLFNRNHNYIAAKLLEINERGTYVDPATLSGNDPVSKTKLLAQEEELFQTARLINCGWFGMVVFSDYFSSILGLVREGNSWSLTPFDEIRMEDHSLFERGKGNSCSVEFNCLYRWHSTTSQEDEQWTRTVFRNLFGDNKPFEQLTVEDFKLAAAHVARKRTDNSQWTFGGIKRQTDGGFRDDDLANFLHNATEHSAGAFRARGVPAVMRLNEIMGIQQSRSWGVCSINDFRKFLGLKPFKTFLEWNSDPEIAVAAERLYGDIEHLELYVGLQAEEAKPLVDGAGLCPGYTVSRAILSDAIALTRGDRFFTHDFSPHNLTAWGFADCQRDSNAFGFGSTLGRLLLRTLPNHFTENSIYTFFPLMTPASMKTILTKLDVLDQYDLSRPKAKSPVTSIKGYSNVTAILGDKENFTSPYAARAAKIIKGNGFYPVEGEKERLGVVAAFSTPDLIKGIGEYFYEQTKELISANHYVLADGHAAGVDLTRCIFKALPMSWAAAELAGIKLKSKEDSGEYTALELYDALGDIYEFIFLDVEASKIKVLEAKTKKHVTTLIRLIKGALSNEVGSMPSLSRVINAISKPKKTEHHDVVKRLYELSHSKDQLANTVLALMVSTVELSLVITNAVNFFLGSEHAAKVTSLAKSNDGKALDGYVYEALRLDPTFRGVFRVASNNHTMNGREFKKTDRVLLDVLSANLDEKIFANAGSFNTSRPTKDRIYPDGAFSYLGEGLTIKIATQVLRAIFEYDDLRRAPGHSGCLHRFKHTERPELNHSYLSKSQSLTPWPSSVSILFSTGRK